MCGAVHDEPLGHIPAPYSGYAPTCTASGATNGEICTRCGDVVTPRRTISATGHSFNAWEPLPGGLHTAVCSTSSCGASGVLPCSCFSAELNGAEVSVYPICGRCGDFIFRSLVFRMDDALPMGQLLVRGVEAPFPGVLYAFTATGSYAGETVSLEGGAFIAPPEDLPWLPLFTMQRVDVLDGVQTLTEIPCRLIDGQMSFTVDTAGLYLILATQ